MKTEKSGFTLIELLVVIAIIAILAAMLLPAPGKTQSVSCMNVMKQNAPGYTLDGVVIAYVKRYPAVPRGAFFPEQVTYWPALPQPTNVIKCPTEPFSAYSIGVNYPDCASWDSHRPKLMDITDPGDTLVSVSARSVKSKFPSII